MRLDDLTVEVRNVGLQRVGIITSEDLDLEFVPLHNNVGTWKITLPSEHPMTPHLKQPGSGIVITWSGGTFSGPTIQPEENATPEDQLGKIEFSGVGDAVILADNLAWPEPGNSDVSTQTVGHDERTGVAETLMHEYVSYNIGPNASAERMISNLSMGTNGARGASITKQARFPTLGELLTSIAQPENLGFRVYQDGATRVFETYATVDRSRIIRLSMDNGGISGQKVTTAAPGVTRAIVAGGGQLTDRVFVERTTPESLEAEEAWGRRIEKFVDQRQTKVITELQQAGDEALAEGGFTAVGIQVVPAEDSNMEFGTDWYLGDAISIEVDGVETKVTAIGAVVKADSDGLRVGIMLGDDLAFSGSDAAEIAGIKTRVSALERNSEELLDSGWITPTLTNSWVNFGGAWATAAYRKVGNRVYLRGTIKSGTSGASAFTLPAGFRPTAHVQHAIDTSSGTGRGKVQSDGQVIVIGATGSISLDTITFFTD